MLCCCVCSDNSLAQLWPVLIKLCDRCCDSSKIPLKNIYANSYCSYCKIVLTTKLCLYIAYQVYCLWWQKSIVLPKRCCACKIVLLILYTACFSNGSTFTALLMKYCAFNKSRPIYKISMECSIQNYLHFQFTCIGSLEKNKNQRIHFSETPCTIS